MMVFAVTSRRTGVRTGIQLVGLPDTGVTILNLVRFNHTTDILASRMYIWLMYARLVCYRCACLCHKNLCHQRNPKFNHAEEPIQNIRQPVSSLVSHWYQLTTWKFQWCHRYVLCQPLLALASNHYHCCSQPLKCVSRRLRSPMVSDDQIGYSLACGFNMFYFPLYSG